MPPADSDVSALIERLRQAGYSEEDAVRRAYQMHAQASGVPALPATPQLATEPPLTAGTRLILPEEVGAARARQINADAARRPTTTASSPTLADVLRKSYESFRQMTGK